MADIKQLNTELEIVKSNLSIVTRLLNEYKTSMTELSNSLKNSNNPTDSAMYVRSLMVLEEIDNKYNNILSKYNKLKESKDAVGKFDTAGIDEIIAKSAKASEEIKKFGVELTRGFGDSTRQFKGADTTSKTNEEEQEKLNKTVEAIKKYVAIQETLSGKKMPLAAQLEYYMQQLEKFKVGSSQYLEVLKLQRNIEQQIENESIKDKERKTKEDQDNLNKRMDAIRKYVSMQETLSGTKMSAGQKIDYYNDQLKGFRQNSNEYMEILRLRRQAEAEAANESKRKAEEITRTQKEAAQRQNESINNTINSIRSFARSMSNAVNKIIGVIKTAINIITKIVQGIVGFISTIKRGIQGLIQLFGNLGNRVASFFGITISGSNAATKSFNLLKGSATELRSKLLLIAGAFERIFNNKLFKQAEQLYQSVYSLNNIVGPSLTTDTIEWAKSMEYAFGLSAKQLLADINELTGVLYGLGMSSKDVAVGSQNILMMSRYLSFMGAAGGDAQIVMGKFVSGMKGMTASIDDLGLSVREAEMDSFLKSLKAQGGEFANIGTSFANLNEEARVYVRYASLIQQFTSKYDITEFENALKTTTGQISIMKQQIYDLGSTIGMVFVQMAAKIAPYIIYVVDIVRTAIKSIVDFINDIFNFSEENKIKLDITEDMNGGIESSDKLEESMSNVKDTIDNTNESAKDLQGTLFGIDRISKFDKATGSKSLSSEELFDYSKLMGDALGGLNEIAKNVEESFIERLKKEVNSNIDEFKNNMLNSIKDLTGRANFDIEFDSAKAKESLVAIKNDIIAIIKNIGLDTISIALKIADDLNIGLLTNKFLDLINAITRLVRTMTEQLGPVFQTVYDKYLSPYVELFGVYLSEKIDLAIGKIEETIITVQELGSYLSLLLSDKTKSLDEVLAMENFEKEHPKLAAFVQTTKDLLENLDKIGLFFKESKSSEEIDGLKQFKEAHPVLSDFLEILNSIKEIGQTIWNDILKPSLADLAEFGKNEFLPWLNEELKQLADWVEKNKDKIKELLDKLANFAWESFKTFVDVVGTLINFIVQNPDAAIKFFEILIGIKIAAWAANSVAGLIALRVNLGLLRGQMAGFGSFGGFGRGFGGFGGFGRGFGGFGRGFGGGVGRTPVPPRLALPAAGQSTASAGTAAKVGLGSKLAGVAQGAGITSAGAGLAASGAVAGLVASIIASIEGVKFVFDVEGQRSISDAYANTEAYQNSSFIDKLLGTKSNAFKEWDATRQNAAKAWEDIATESEMTLAELATKVNATEKDLKYGLVDPLELSVKGWEKVSAATGLELDKLVEKHAATGQKLVENNIKDAENLITHTSIASADSLMETEKFYSQLASSAGITLDQMLEKNNLTYEDIKNKVIDTSKMSITEWQNIADNAGLSLQQTLNSAGTTNDDIIASYAKLKSKSVDEVKELESSWGFSIENMLKEQLELEKSYGVSMDNIGLETEKGGKAMEETFGDHINNIINKIKEAFANFKSLFTGEAELEVTTSGTEKKGMPKTGKNVRIPELGIKSRAIGGTLNSGDFFIANENGSVEQIGKVGNKTAVANQTMITQSMADAIQRAIVEVLPQGNGQSGNIEINLNGFGLVTQDSVNTLASMLRGPSNSMSSNISNLNFTI